MMCDMSVVYKWPPNWWMVQEYRKFPSWEEALAWVDSLRLDGFEIFGWVGRKGIGDSIRGTL
jgi:sugar phosphate isomerase/epimerase